MIKMAYNFNTQITFENGLTISIAIGEGNYCENRNFHDNPFRHIKPERQSKNCEVLVFNAKTNKDMSINQFIPEGQSNDGRVAGWVTPDVLAQIISNVASWKDEKVKENNEGSPGTWSYFSMSD